MNPTELYKQIKSRNIKTIKKLLGKTVLLRTDFNVPISQHNRISKHSRHRIDTSLPTIKHLLQKGAKVIIISHHGDTSQTLKPIGRLLSREVGKIGFCPITDKKTIQEITSRIKNGHAILLENIRKFPEETEDDAKFGKWLSSLADIYINEAFSVSHRKHASITQPPKHIPSYFGLNFTEEIKQLSPLLTPQQPFVAILGGHKFSTKIKLLKKLLPLSQKIIITGALANTFLKNRGFNIGKSLHEEIDTSKIDKPNKIILPEIVIIDRNGTRIKTHIKEIQPNDIIIDTTKHYSENIQPIIKNAKTVFINGPAGWYEKGQISGTKYLISLISKKQISIAGGGDIAYLINKLNMQNNIKFVSTGGGATLSYITNPNLPGINAILKNTPKTN